MNSVQTIFVFFAIIAATTTVFGYPQQHGSETTQIPDVRGMPKPLVLIPEDYPQTKHAAAARERRQLADEKRFSSTVDINHNRGSGTNVNAEAQARLWQSQNRRTDVTGNANYNQHFGGPGGRSKPNYGAGVTFRHRF